MIGKLSELRYWTSSGRNGGRHFGSSAGSRYAQSNRCRPDLTSTGSGPGSVTAAVVPKPDAEASTSLTGEHERRTETIGDFAAMLHTELLVIDARTASRGFADHVRWNAPYYGLTGVIPGVAR
jgi:hypothetical protein